MPARRSLQESWPFGKKFKLDENFQPITDEKAPVDEEKFAKYLALAAKSAGLLSGEDSEDLKATIDALRKILVAPAHLAKEIKKLGKSTGVGTRTLKQLRKDL